MTMHPFLFQQGTWLGVGELQISGSAEALPIFTRWEVEAMRKKRLSCKQVVEIPSAHHKGINYYRLTLLTTNEFEIELRNELLHTKGHGLITDNAITWKYEDKETLKGEETFTLQTNDEYLFRANFFSAVQQETHINGKIWKTSNVS